MRSSSGCRFITPAFALALALSWVECSTGPQRIASTLDLASANDRRRAGPPVVRPEHSRCRACADVRQQLAHRRAAPSRTQASAGAADEGRPSRSARGGGWGRRRRRAGSGRRRASRHHAAAAIIAALSVHIGAARAGSRAARRPRTRRGTARAAASWPRRRRRGTGRSPRPRPPRGGPWSTSTSTTASWNDAATSAVLTSGCLRTWLTTAVLSPLKEKSKPSSSIARGKRDRVGSPLHREPVDRRAARVAEAEEAGDLVERLAGGVVDASGRAAGSGRGPPSRRASCARPTRAGRPRQLERRAPRAAPRRGAPRGGSRRRTARPTPARAPWPRSRRRAARRRGPGRRSRATASIALVVDARLDERLGDHRE